ncbi:sensor histidine kinase [Paracoccus denitrificans]|uniref:sensor histidine kinase n=1 Tax=Paracoccus denitrificans TaxID=266 RepID=UPI001F1B93EC|nr:ATP-binding protein [Paracoccus denitrificans]
MTSRPFPESPIKLTLLGGLVLLVPVLGMAVAQQRALMAELAQESAVLHRLASQRADQHDAHLTALSAIAVASDDQRQALFLDVAATITRFYPRIDEIGLVPLDAQARPLGTVPPGPALADQIRAAARASGGEIALLPHPDRPDHYVMVKRSPNSDAARYGLMLGIDAARLLDEAGAFWDRPGVGLALSLPDGPTLFRKGATVEGAQFSKGLGSISQPLRLDTGMVIGWADLFPPLRTGLILLAAGLAWLGGLSALRQRARARQAMEQARLSALESRLAHASRVNALGEMASGLTHELTQPLTAILAQAQAGRRLLARGDAAALAPVLDDTVTQARRASAILERFRNWSRPQQAPGSAFDLRDALRNVEALLARQAASQGLHLVLDLPGEPVPVLADPVEMEQVVFNLLRNAIEATAGMGREGRAALHLRRQAGTAVLEVSDNGPGVAPDLRARLFTPFTTTRTDGTGLGLALSQRLVERAGGEIALVEDGAGATFRVVLPLNQTGPDDRR